LASGFPLSWRTILARDVRVRPGDSNRTDQWSGPDDEPKSALVGSIRHRWCWSSSYSVIFISHNVHHAYVIGDRFTLLKRGRSTGTYAKDEIDRDQLLNLMAGGKELVDLEQELARSARNGSAQGWQKSFG
jgi:ABC-type sulfate/molybdate transport systems ATPase subunit